MPPIDSLTRTGHDMTLKVNISGLKAKLSSYLDAVRRGATVTVLDRRTPIARIIPLDSGLEGLRIESACSPPDAIGDVKGVRPKRPVGVVALLAESRGEH